MLKTLRFSIYWLINLLIVSNNLIGQIKYEDRIFNSSKDSLNKMQVTYSPITDNSEFQYIFTIPRPANDAQITSIKIVYTSSANSQVATYSYSGQNASLIIHSESNSSLSYELKPYGSFLNSEEFTSCQKSSSCQIIVKDENMTNHNIKIPLVKIADSLTRYRNTFQSQLKQEILKVNEIVKIPSKPKPELSEFLNGVSTIVIDYKMIWKDFSELCFYRGTQEFFKQHGFNIKENTNDGYSTYRPSTDICTEAWVSLECVSFNEQLSNMKMIIRTDCGNYEYIVDLGGTIDISKIREMNANYNARVADFIASKFKINHVFDRGKSLNDQKFKTGWNEKMVRAKINHFGYDDLEGIYELNYTVQGQRLKVAVQKIKDTYTFIYLSGHSNENNWLTGEIIGYVTEGTDLGNYVVSWCDFRKKWTHNMILSYVNNLYKIAGSDPKNVYFFKKLFPTAQDKALKNNPEMIASGTGWAISSNGYVITNYHVVEGSNQFALRGVKGDFSLKYNLRVILLDKENDLAILKVDDSKFSGFGTIPYTISGFEGEVGASVYVLGYPLLASMGTEVKLTTGVISSSSGFQGDKRLYQISAPVQPGNSGGPMLSYKGNLIGIVNAKHFEAENASYAIKSSILLGLIKENGLNISLPTSNLLSGKSLSEQVKLVRNFTYIIEVY